MNGLAQGKFESGSVENVEKHIQMNWGKGGKLVRIYTNTQNATVACVL